jgi:hypothetical protein
LHQIIRGTNSTAEYEIYYNNELVNADGVVHVHVSDADYDILIAQGEAYNDPAIGKYTFDLTSDVTSLNRVLKVSWSYLVNGKQTSQDDFYEVYTPYASISSIISHYDFGTRPEDLNYRSVTEIAAAEKIARMQIDGYTMQTFGRVYGYQEVFGIGSDAIELTQRMVNLQKLYENGILMIDRTVDPQINLFGYDVQLTPTNKAVRIINQGYGVNYDTGFDIASQYAGRFRDGYRYQFYGEMGWLYVPSDISSCAVILAGDYLSQDAQWRNKYLKKVDLSEVSFELTAGAFNGTGNVIVDSVLDNYRNTGIVVI